MDSLETLIANAGNTVRQAKPFQAPDYSEPCKGCRGTGRFVSWSGRVVGNCFKCKGAGKVTFRTSPETRKAAADSKAIKKLDSMTALKTAKPAVFAWLFEELTFPFQVSLKENFLKFGDLTDGQLAAAEKCIAARANATAQKAEAIASAPVVDVAKIEEAFCKAKASGIKRPKLNLAGFKFKPAPSHGKNPDSIYVMEGETYLGKISASKFIKAFACTDATAQEVVSVASDPGNSAKAYGLRTGSCSCCGRTLTDPVSIDMGIGPVCAERYGFL